MNTSQSNPEKILAENKEWASALPHDIRLKISSVQNPWALYISCIDSRVINSSLTQSLPNEMFIVRNIAALVRPDDAALVGSIEFAIEAGICHIIVCGHTECGGVKSAYAIHEMDHSAEPYLELRKKMPATLDWVQPIKRLIPEYRAELDAQPEGDARTNLLSRLSTVRQAETLCTIPAVKQALEDGRLKTVEAWVFNLQTAEIEPLASFDKNGKLARPHATEQAGRCA